MEGGGEERERVRERGERLTLIIRDILNTITDLRNVTEEEKEVALKALDAAVTWFESKQTEQFAVAKNVDPVLTSEEVMEGERERGRGCEREREGERRRGESRRRGVNGSVGIEEAA